MRQRYQQLDITTASPEALVAKLFDGAIDSARRARALEEPQAIADRGQAISKAVAIVGELRSALDLDKGGEIAANLDGLYEFVIGRLLEANLQRTGEPLDDAIQILGTLGEAWHELAAQGRAAS